MRKKRTELDTLSSAPTAPVSRREFLRRAANTARKAAGAPAAKEKRRPKLEISYPYRYTGPRWAIHYGSYAGIEKTAINELQRQLQSYLPYVIPTYEAAAGVYGREDNLAIIGTIESNPLLAELAQQGLLNIPTTAESYNIFCCMAPFGGKNRLLVICGTDAKGILNGVYALGAEVLAGAPQIDQDLARREIIEKLADFSISDAPAIQERGLWTWGYVIYDYRGYLDNMARLRMNTLVVWNDEVPVNCAAFIDYAHDRGIKVIMGFHWGWGLDEQLDLANPQHCELVKQEVLKNYQENYHHLDIDGIYFQTLTEHGTLEKAGKSTATLACEWVNHIAEGLFQINPELRIIFGLHATSIRQHYTDLTALDERISIMWEDAGVLPYTYAPDLGAADENGKYPQFEDTIAYSKQLATIRPDTGFEIVPKGYTSLRWGSEFEHHGSFVIGERDADFIRQRTALRQTQWDGVNARWLQYYQYGVRFYREILTCQPSHVTAVALVEDGMFEARIQSSVALFAQTVWNPQREPEEILRAALSSYYNE
jgi:hypothetical protein